MKKIIFGITICFLIQQTVSAQVKILFDASKAETAGNADWVIDADLHNMSWNPFGSTGGGNESNAVQTPTPAQSGIIASTPETYWTGSLSNWGVDCAKQGYLVESLSYLGQISYGNTGNPQDLSNYKIFIVDEPNILFTALQKTAMMNFVLNGGSLFMISDHTMSDRNNDGNDSPVIWNDFLTNNTVQNNAFGILVDLQNFSQTSNNVIAAAGDSIIHGPMGNVTQVKWTSGTSATLNPSQNTSVTGVVYKTGSSGNTGVLCAYARWGCGKVAFVGDSSIPDDGTGDPNDVLYNGYIVDAAGNHQRLLMNITIWLAEGNCSVGINSAKENTGVDIFPNPATNSVTINLANNSDHTGLSVFDMDGKQMQVTQNRTNNQVVLFTDNLASGVYFIKISMNNETLNRKLIISK